MVPLASNDLLHNCVLFLSKRMKIRKRKKKPAKKLVADVPTADESFTAHDHKEERMDFGGLPDRDLKKNLGGCG